MKYYVILLYKYCILCKSTGYRYIFCRKFRALKFWSPWGLKILVAALGISLSLVLSTNLVLSTYWFFPKHLLKSIWFGFHGYNPHALNPLIIISLLTVFMRTLFNIGAKCFLVTAQLWFLFLHSNNPFFQPAFKGLNAETSAGCNNLVALGYKAIRIIFSFEQRLLNSYVRWLLCPSTKRITGNIIFFSIKNG